jgi:redox-sensing transcriptional repressor
MLPEKTIGRLSLYRRLLMVMRRRGVTSVFSHELAGAARVTAAQVRRDIMAVGYVGSPVHGYNVIGLMEKIADVLDAVEAEGVALVGIGNLGRAVMAYFSGRRPKLPLVAAFDVDPAKVGRVIHGVRCYAVDEMDRVIAEKGIHLGIIAVPAAQAQAVADRLMQAGVRGILNFAPTPLKFAPGVFVEGLDMTSALEKAAYYARRTVGNVGRLVAETQ